MVGLGAGFGSMFGCAPLLGFCVRSAEKSLVVTLNGDSCGYFGIEIL